MSSDSYSGFTNGSRVIKYDLPIVYYDVRVSKLMGFMISLITRGCRGVSEIRSTTTSIFNHPPAPDYPVIPTKTGGLDTRAR